MNAEKKQKTPEEIRADARQRKRDQRSREYAIRDELRLASMDRAERNLIELFAKVALEPRKPQPPPAAPGPPQPARLPTLHKWLDYLRSLRPTQAIAEEVARVEAAIASGMAEFPERNETNIWEITRESVIASGIKTSADGRGDDGQEDI